MPMCRQMFLAGSTETWKPEHVAVRLKEGKRLPGKALFLSTASHSSFPKAILHDSTAFPHSQAFGPPEPFEAMDFPSSLSLAPRGEDVPPDSRTREKACGADHSDEEWGNKPHGGPMGLTFWKSFNQKIGQPIGATQRETIWPVGPPEVKDRFLRPPLTILAKLVGRTDPSRAVPSAFREMAWELLYQPSQNDQHRKGVR